MDQQLLTDALNKASDLRRAGDHESALNILLPLYQQPELHYRMDLISGLLYSLQKVGRYLEAIEIATPTCERDDVWDSIKQNLAWSIYFQYFKKNAAHLEAEKAVVWLEKLKQVFPQKPGLHPLPLCLFAWVNAHPEAQPSLQVQLCGLVDPNMLDRSCVPPQGERPALPSQFERYCSILSKALFASQQYDRCKTMCEDMLKCGVEISPNNLIWLRRRIALCMDALGDHTAALAEMREILQRKRDWFLYHEAARIALATGDLSLALSLASSGAMAWGDVENKIHLWELLQQLLILSKQFDRALELLLLIASIRKHKGWNVNADLGRDLKAHNVDMETLPHFKDLFQKAKAWLPDLQTLDSPTHDGKIIKLLPDGKAGFVESEGQSSYIRISECRFHPRDAIPGRKVRFNLERSFDRKKQRESMAAVNIRML